jgi:hypothetical protein
MIAAYAGPERLRDTAPKGGDTTGQHVSVGTGVPTAATAFFLFFPPTLLIARSTVAFY